MKRLIGVLTFSIMLISTAAAEKITLVADRWDPFNGEPNSKLEGYMVDIARSVFKREGITINYLIVPWKRAVAGTKEGLYTGAIGASKIDAKGLIFPKEELARNTLAFYVKKGNPWRYSGRGSLQKVKLGTIGGYDYRQWLNDYIEANKADSSKVQILVGHTPLVRNIRKLLAERIDVIVDNDAAIRSAAKQLGVLNQIEAAGYGSEPSYCYIAFSPKLAQSQRYAQILSDGITELRNTGKLQEILNKYGLVDWRN